MCVLGDVIIHSEVCLTFLHSVFIFVVCIELPMFFCDNSYSVKGKVPLTFRFSLMLCIGFNRLIMITQTAISTTKPGELQLFLYLDGISLLYLKKEKRKKRRGLAQGRPVHRLSNMSVRSK